MVCFELGSRKHRLSVASKLSRTTAAVAARDDNQPDRDRRHMNHFPVIRKHCSLEVNRHADHYTRHIHVVDKLGVSIRSIVHA